MSRELIAPEQLSDGGEVSLRRVLDPSSSVTLGTFGRSLISGGDADRTVNVRVGDRVYNVPKEIVTRQDGRLDVDGMRQYNR